MNAEVMNTVQLISDNKMCVLCGACMALCSAKCISVSENNDDKYAISVDSEQCRKCGLCMRVCPGGQVDYDQMRQVCQYEADSDAFIGQIKQLLNVAAHDEETLNAAVSGGFITTVIEKLLESGEYDAAVSVVDFDCSKPIKSCILQKETFSLEIAKSRYVPVIHTDAYQYIIHNRKKKIIFVGTPCAIHALLKITECIHMDKGNIFIIGLFCDRNFTYKINDYFSSQYANGEEIKKLYFRTKENGGWPGGVKFELSGKSMFFDSQIRSRVKNYFQMERCMYCLDKLAQFADISVGDNYTKDRIGANGENTIIIRSELGMKIWEKTSQYFYTMPTTLDAMIGSQHIDNKKNNIAYAQIAEKKYSSKINVGGIFDTYKCTADKRFQYARKLSKIRIGRKYRKSNVRIETDIFMDKVRRKLHL